MATHGLKPRMFCGQLCIRIAAVIQVCLGADAIAFAQQGSPIAERLLNSGPAKNTDWESQTPWSVPAARRATRPFQVLVWQHRTDALRDSRLYDRVHLRGWHIDRGEGQQKRAEWGASQQRPFYIDHAAGKGILHLTSRSGLNDVPKDGSPVPRPQSFLNNDVWKELTRRIDRHLPAVVNEQTVAIALDDEVSLGSFNSPLEVGFSSASISLFRRWLKQRYSSEGDFQSAWSKSSTFEKASPVTFEEVRGQISQQSPSQWRLAPWMNFRAFMDRQQATAFAGLVNSASQHAEDIPVGIVGSQQPSAYGGFDYSILRHSVQWMEAYDIGGTNELLQSFWSESPRRPRMQTFFSSGRLSDDKWFLWYYLAHGCSGVIAWPEFQGNAWFHDGQVHPAIKALAPTFQEIQTKALSVVSAPSTTPIFSDIAVLYSHPSVQVGWAIDASAHGRTWPRRSSSLDNQCLSSGKNRIAWTRLLEDLGHQPRIIDTNELQSGFLEQKDIKVLILPQCFALSPSECDAIRRFAESGGTVMADYGTAITDNNGTGYQVRPLDEMFGLSRQGPDNWFDERSRFEINGEKYKQPFLDRLPAENCVLKDGLPVAERDLATTRITHQSGEGRTLYLNQSPTAYFDPAFRASDRGQLFRKWIGEAIQAAGVTEPLRVVREDGRTFGVELLRYRTSTDSEVWAVVCNPTRQARIDSAATGLTVDRQTIEIELVLSESQSAREITDLRRNETIVVKDGRVKLSLKNDEAEILKISR